MFASFVLISAIMFVIAASTVVQFTQLGDDLTDIVQNQMPEIVQVNEIAASVTELAAMATLLGEPHLRADQPEFQSRLNLAISVLAEKIKIASETGLVSAQSEIEGHINLLLSQSDNQFLLEKAMIGRAEEIRWLQADFQGEISPLLLDISFNIENAISQLAEAQGESWFQAEFELLRSESFKRDLVQDAGREGAFAITAMLQATNVQNIESLDQFADISAESLDRASRYLGELGDAGGLITLKQSLDRLRQLSEGEDGIFSLGRRLVQTRQLVFLELAATQQSLSRFQSKLSAIGSERRNIAAQVAGSALEGMQMASGRVVALTIAGLLAATAIVVFYVRRRIVARLRELSVTLRAIARGETEGTPIPSGSDEIGRMGHAVEVFRRSVREREENLLRLETEIVERERTNQQLQKTQADLVQAGKLAALGQLSAGISHELNQPISATRFAAHNTLTRLRAGIDEQAMEKALLKIIRMTDRMSALVKQFARFARRSDYTVARMSLLQSVDRSIELLQARLAEHSNIAIEIVRDGLDHEVLADPLLVEQVLVNLISNAVDAIEEASQQDGLISLTGSVSGQFLTITIKDNGVGLQHTSQDPFDPFVTTKEVGKGTGLGLSISYTIVQDLGGTLRLEDNIGAGASAHLELRLAT
ncbi:ATP-binding protein [Maritalea porphyrae]|uniref:ATP-binding protein n=1 Tax=Maritalea porphyrae TaxID=880732 RepID=UPI0022AE82E9|nr:ATP-binding protein [Maritalea porphyrae]MCZ4273410.1 ATP-binding protein [Maritalea porphyrae]